MVFVVVVVSDWINSIRLVWKKFIDPNGYILQKLICFQEKIFYTNYLQKSQLNVKINKSIYYAVKPPSTSTTVLPSTASKTSRPPEEFRHWRILEGELTKFLRSYRSTPHASTLKTSPNFLHSPP